MCACIRKRTTTKKTIIATTNTFDAFDIFQIAFCCVWIEKHLFWNVNVMHCLLSCLHFYCNYFVNIWINVHVLFVFAMSKFQLWFKWISHRIETTEIVSIEFVSTAPFWWGGSSVGLSIRTDSHLTWKSTNTLRVTNTWMLFCCLLAEVMRATMLMQIKRIATVVIHLNWINGDLKLKGIFYSIYSISFNW